MESHEDDIGVFFYYEIDESGVIKRQIEIYQDFSFGLACDDFQYNTFRSGDQINLDDINESIIFDDESKTFFISGEQFDAVWDFFISKMKCKTNHDYKKA
ncbi:hypothetical protein A4G20_08030 [Pasteurellaceae bacterium RH1A]|nr:hypothetical protein A4G20_08030 [Pasteurellaceae bacterium RH1A]